MIIAAGAASFAGGLLQAQEVTTFTSETVETTEVSADPHRVETNGFWDNWNVAVAAGPQIYFGDHNKQMRLGDRISPALDISIGKWFSPSIGLRLMYSGLYVKGATQNGSHSTGEAIKGKPWSGYWLTEQKFSYYNIHMDVMLNLHNIIAGYKPNRFWSTSIYAGVGYAHVWESPQASEVTLNAGIINTFRISRKLDANIDIRGMMVNDRFSGDVGNRFEEGILSVTAGLTYWFTNGWDRSKTIYRETYTTTDISDLNRRINEMSAENERLRQALANGERSTARTIIKNIAGSIFIVFPINKSTLNDESRVNLKLLSELINQSDPEDKFLITGYADKATGNAEINERLSRDRAQAVYDCLVNEFHVSPSRLVIDYKGGVENMFYNDPRLSRASIVRLQED